MRRGWSWDVYLTVFAIAALIAVFWLGIIGTTRAAGHVVGGIASTYGPACRVRCLALPEGPGHRVRVCGPAACVTRTSNDAGPSLAMQRAGRVVDLSLLDFERVSGRSWRTGLVRVTVEYIGRGPQPTLPPTDTAS